MRRNLFLKMMLMLFWPNLRKGKSSPDGIAVEMFKQMPLLAKEGLAQMLNHWFYYLGFPASWFEMKAVLIPKFVGAHQLGHLRAIAVLVAMRKLMGIGWLFLLPPICIKRASRSLSHLSSTCVSEHEVVLVET